ncbi:MAG: twin transmembrane helix small protein [Methylococcaceae bacterium]|nr:twin transmembrane helix small protein [Methylococcaceae bacterium]
MIKSIVILAFMLIIFSLGSALFHLVKHNGQEQSQNTVKALTYRIILSIILFLFVFIAIGTGLFKPSGIGTQMQINKQIQANQLK